MFLSYINELIAILETYGIVVRAFADDVKMYVRIVHDVNLLQLQHAINALLKWADEWQLTVSVDKCCVLNIGQIVLMPHLMMHNEVLPNVNEVRDLGIKVTNYLSPSDHVCDIAAKAHKRASLIHRCFVSRNTDLLVRAYKVYVRPLLEYNSVIWSPSTIRDIETIESVQRRFTKRIRGLHSLSYKSRLQQLNLQSLEHRRLLTDLVWCYKVIFGLVNVNTTDLFEFSTITQTRGHMYKLFKKSNSRNIRTTFFCERVINIWNKLPADTDFSSLVKFKCCIASMDFSDYLQCF